MSASAPPQAEPGFAFDYEESSIIQGRGEISSHQRDLAGLRLARCLRVLPAGPGRLLLAGCGAGRHVRALRRERPEFAIHGSDLSLTAVREAVTHRDGAAYTVADVLALPYRDAAFTAVVVFDLLEHVPDIEQSVAELARVLRPGGVIHAFVPCEAQPGTLFAWMLHGGPTPIHRWKRDHVGHIQQLTVAETEGLFARHGLRPVHRSYSFHALGQTHDMLDYWRRETMRDGHGARAQAARLLTRGLMPFTWRLAYLEAELMRSWPRATGLHLTAVRD